MKSRKSSYMIRSWQEAKNLNKTETLSDQVTAVKCAYAECRYLIIIFWEGIRTRAQTTLGSVMSGYQSQ